jgi:hypothetical protein
MEICGYRKEVDLTKMGPTLVIASSLILAIRTAKRSGKEVDETAPGDWAAEVERSVQMAHRILHHLVAKSAFLFPQREVPWYQPGEEDSPK